MDRHPCIKTQEIYDAKASSNFLLILLQDDFLFTESISIRKNSRIKWNIIFLIIFSLIAGFRVYPNFYNLKLLTIMGLYDSTRNEINISKLYTFKFSYFLC